MVVDVGLGFISRVSVAFCVIEIFSEDGDGFGGIRIIPTAKRTMNITTGIKKGGIIEKKCLHGCTYTNTP